MANTTRKSLRILTGQHGNLSSFIQKESKNVEELLAVKIENIDVDDAHKLPRDIEKILSKLTDYSRQLESLNSDILVAMELAEKDEQEIDAEIDKQSEKVSELSSLIAELRGFQEGVRVRIRQLENLSSEKLDQRRLEIETERLNLEQEESRLRERHRETESTSIRLKEVEFEKFGGNVLKWTEFWNAYSVNIHENPRCTTNVQKFYRLKDKLFGEAAKLIENLPVTNSNYDVAIRTLKERYGDNQIVISAHYNAIMNLNPSSGKAGGLRSLYLELSKHFRSLEALGCTPDQDVFISIIQSKLPSEVIVQLERSRDRSQKWDVTLLLKELNSFISAEEAAQRVSSGHHHEKSHEPPGFPKRLSSDKNLSEARGSSKAPISTGMQLANVTSRRPSCIFCSRQNHWSSDCRTFPDLSSRKEKVKNRCWLCLSDKHSRQKCPSKKPCFYCKQERHHHSSLCPKKFGSVSSSSSSPPEAPTLSAVQTSEAEKSEERPTGVAVSSIVSPKNEAALSSREDSSEVFMQIAKTVFRNPNNPEKVITGRILFDSASTNSYLRQSVAKHLNLQKKEVHHTSVATFGSLSLNKKECWSTKVEVQLMDKSFQSLDLLVTPTITSEIHRAPIQNEKLLSLSQKLPMAEPIPFESEIQIDLLLGIKDNESFLEDERFQLKDKLWLRSTKFGWMFSGSTEGQNSPNFTEHSLFCFTPMDCALEEPTLFSKVDSCLAKPNFEDFSSLETIGIRDSPTESEDDTALEAFNESVKFEDGRYFIQYPKRAEIGDLPDNRGLAYGRFVSLLKRFQAKPELLSKCAAIIGDQEKKGVIEKVDDTSENQCHYIPFHPIEKAGSTTSCRLVYDASAKNSKNSRSLNECLLRGPVILPDLVGLLLRFRSHKFVVIADIEKAFLQIAVQPADRDLTRFFWLKNPEVPAAANNVQLYRFARVPFGIISSPFLLAATLKYHFSQSMPAVAKQLLKNTYVDNIMLVSDAENPLVELPSFYADSKTICAEMSMNLREYASNSSEFMESLPEIDRNKSSCPKVFGIHWDLSIDSISLLPIKPGNSEFTKREVLHTIASVFDPLGLFSFVTIRGKLFLQNLWKEKFDWDVHLPVELKAEWDEIVILLKNLSSISISRCVVKSSGLISLVCFVDASLQAYAACLYLKVGESVNLIFAKSRLAPVNKNISVPRMELLAVLIGIRAMKFVSSQLQLPIAEKILFSDSTCVLYWLRSAKPLAVFVENRIREIRENSCDVSFRYISSSENPADFATKVCSVESAMSSLWWFSPSWLALPKENWPSTIFPEYTAEQISEINAEFPKSFGSTFELGLVVGSPPDGEENSNFVSPFGIKVEKYSSLSKLLRVTTWCSRFVHSLTERKHISGPLTATEIEKAKLLWDLYVQKSNYESVIRACKAGTKNQLKDQLGLVLDSNGVLRCQGRLVLAELTDEARLPKLLPPKQHFTNLTVRAVHNKLFHARLSQTLAELRFEYWLPKGRAEVRRILSSCLICRYHEGAAYKAPRFPALPKSRVSKSVPFTFIGIDYFGPLYIRTETESRKVWVILFACLTVRAIHLELVSDMTAEQFLYAFRRFVARFGCPQKVISDNAPQFKVTSNTLQRAWHTVIIDPTVQNFSSENKISWQFISPFAPWMGGFYERLVGIVKRSLKKAIGKKHLSFEQLRTFLAEVQAVVNSRPIVYVSSEFDENSTLTPADFLSLNRKHFLPGLHKDSVDPDFVEQPNSAENLLKLWKFGNEYIHQFWIIWRDDYLLSLRERQNIELKGQRKSISQIPCIGEVVLIREKYLPRGSWKIGRITKLIRSNDHHIRSVKLKIPNQKRELIRPIILIHPLEIRSRSESPMEDGLPETPAVESSENEKTENLRVRRKAAVAAEMKIADMFNSELFDSDNE